MSFILRVTLIFLLCCLRDGSVGSQITAYEGQTVVLPCILAPRDNPIVVWKYRENKNFVKVKEGKVAERAHDRVTTFPEQHPKGNFSIRISDVNVNDSSRYECHLEGDRKYIDLTVTKNPEEPAVQPKGGAVVPGLSACVLVLLAITLQFM